MVIPSVKVGNAKGSSATCSTVIPDAMHATTTWMISAEYSPRHVCAEDPPVVSVGNEFAESLLVAVRDRAQKVVIVSNPHDDVVVAGRSRLGEADPAVPWVGEAGTRHHVVSDDAARAPERVLGSDAPFKAGDRDQHGPAVDVAWGVDVIDFGAEIGVDWNPLSLALDAGGLEPQLLGVGRPADGEEHDIHDRSFNPGRTGVFHTSGSLEIVWTFTTVSGVGLDALALECPLQSNEMLGSACGTIDWTASNRLTRVPRSARIEAI